MTQPTGPTTFAGLVWRMLRRAWIRLVNDCWYVECGRCARQFGAAAPGSKGHEFASRQAADEAASGAGWLIDDEQDLCPPCRARAGEQVPA